MPNLAAGTFSLALLVAATAALGCGDDGGGEGGAGGSGSTASASPEAASTGGGSSTGEGTGGETSTTSGATESCTATFRVLQKDAYKESAGRSSDLWPPHTTTVLELWCDGGLLDEAVQANHGTAPGDVDAAGDVILVEQGAYEVAGTRDELTALLDAYRDCSCEGKTTFLSLDSVEGALAEDLLETVLGYVQTNLTCPGDDLDVLLAALQEADFETSVAIFPTCTWAGGTSFEEGLSEAFADVIAETGELLADYHVCNNDAAVQKALFDGFAAGGALACDGATLCRGPLWLYVAE